ncbi:Zinc finger and BTB domain-containing protein 20, partial [Stegodyphus mimosarum]
MLIHRKKPRVHEAGNKSFALKFSLDRHVLSYMGETPDVCEICKKSFTLKGNLNCICFFTQERNLMCEIYNKSFTHKLKFNTFMPVLIFISFAVKWCSN